MILLKYSQKTATISCLFFIFAIQNNSTMKKKFFVLISLFIIPIAVYLFFALASHNSLFLDTIQKNVNNFPKEWTCEIDDNITLDQKITILGFAGLDFEKNKGNFFNLNQKIYNKYKEFNDFQLVIIAPQNSKVSIENFLSEMKRISNTSGWKIIYTDTNSILKFYNSLSLKKALNDDFGSSNVIIIDKDRNIRGRKSKNKKGEMEYYESYNTTSAAELHNQMTDDVKILLREYRLALKKNDPNRRKDTNEINNRLNKLKNEK